MGPFRVAGFLVGIWITVGLCDEDSGLRARIVGANNKFAFDLYDAIKDEKGEENIFISPLSLSSCMGMLYMMTNGSTAQEISGAMHFPTDHESTAVGFQQCLKGLDDEALSWANSIFLSNDFEVKQSYMDELKKYWSAAAESLDFSREPKKSREHINSWVANKTNQMIKDLLPESFPEGETAMVLVSALHFKRPWSVKFENIHVKGAFHLANNKSVDVDTMVATDSSFGFTYMKEIKASVLKIPYKGGKQSMLIFLPFRDEKLEDLEKRLKNIDLENNVLKHMQEGRELMVTLPKFKFQDGRKLQASFQKLGMKRMFTSSDADFTRASDNRRLEVNEIYHKTMIVVDEKGTEAAAATGMDIALDSLPMQFEVDRPFVFAIIDSETSLVLFLGRLANPTEQN